MTLKVMNTQSMGNILEPKIRNYINESLYQKDPILKKIHLLMAI